MEHKIDFSKKPEGATHAALVNDTRVCWYKVKPNGKYEYSYQREGCQADGWASSHGKPVHAPLIECPSPTWNGEGLPPVGTVCKSKAKGNPFFESFAGIELEIVMHDVSMTGDPIAVFRWLDPEELEESEGEEASYLYAGMIAGSFEPIKTPEQIAAEEREKAAAAMSNATHGAKDWPEAFRMLHDAGYRKQ